MVWSEMDQIVFLQIKRILEKGLGHLFITSNSGSFYFFNKTNFKQ